MSCTSVELVTRHSAIGSWSSEPPSLVERSGMARLDVPFTTLIVEEYGDAPTHRFRTIAFHCEEPDGPERSTLSVASLWTSTPLPYEYPGASSTRRVPLPGTIDPSRSPAPATA